MHTLETLGFKHYIARAKHTTIPPTEIVARVTAEYGTRYTVYTKNGQQDAMAPKTLITGSQAENRPKVGDWVTLEVIPGDTKLRLTSVLPRFSQLSRKKVGKRLEPQIIATNVDIVYIVESLTNSFDPNRIERFLVVPETAGVQAALILTKADAVAENEKNIFIAEAKARFPTLPILITSIKTGLGIESIAQHLPPGETAVLIGPSGVGKSSLINFLAENNILATSEVRAEDQRGRHTTTVRQLIVLPSGGIIIDTPGMRELQLWGDESTSLETAFGDIEDLALTCKFSDCDHTASHGCAIVAAVKNGNISKERYTSFLKLKTELSHHARRIDYEAKLSKKKREKKNSRNVRTLVRQERGKRSII